MIRRLAVVAALTCAPLAVASAARADSSGCSFGHSTSLFSSTITAICRGQIAGGPTQFQLVVDSGLGYSESSAWKPIGSTVSVTVLGGAKGYRVNKR